MSTSWWASRDPDLGNEPGSKYLGRRDWSWFTPYANGSTAPSEVETATTPWAPHSILPTDRFDRTLGIPDRTTSMWPTYTHPHRTDDQLSLTFERDSQSRGPFEIDQDRVHSIVRDLATTMPPRPGPPDVSPTFLAEILDELAPLVYGRSPSQQQAEIASTARKHDIPINTLKGLAQRTGTLIAKNTRQPAPNVSGDPGLNRLLHADLHLATNLLLARTTLATARAYSDPDLPRLWILANALHHTVPASVFTTQPAISQGPSRDIIPTHDDLVAWPGIRTAIEQLQATADAANQGRLWMTTLKPGAPPHDRILALGIIQLTHPRAAYELALGGNGNLDLDVLRHIATKLPPAHLANLSDGALKAVCDRNNWLHGTPDERTQREIVERDITTALTDDVRTHLAKGDTTALTEAITRNSPTDQDLDHAAWRNQPPLVEAQQRHELLDFSSCEAIYQFSGLQITPHPSKSAAFAARFPNRLSEQGLKTSSEALLLDPSPTPHATLTPDPSRLDIDIPGL